MTLHVKMCDFKCPKIEVFPCKVCVFVKYSSTDVDRSVFDNFPRANVSFQMLTKENFHVQFL